MRILNIITQGECGGAQKNVADISAEMQKRGHEVFVAVGLQSNLSDQWLLDELKKKGFDKQSLFSLQCLVRAIKPIKDIQAFFSIVKLIKTVKPDVVHVHSSKAGALAGVATFITRTKSVYTVHGYIFLEKISGLKKTFYKLVEKINGIFHDHIILMSSKDRRSAQEAGVLGSDGFSIIPNGLDVSKKTLLLSREESVSFFEKQIVEGKDLSDKILVGTVANLYPTKGLGYLIAAAKEIVETNPRVIFVVVGEGEQRQELESQIQKLDLHKNVLLMGSVPEAFRYLKAFDFMVLPSLKEGFPYVVLESALAGLPMVATDVGAIPEMSQHIKSLTVVQPADVSGLIEAIQNKINKSNLEPVLFPEIYSVDVMYESVEKVYKEVLS